MFAEPVVGGSRFGIFAPPVRVFVVSPVLSVVVAPGLGLTDVVDPKFELVVEPTFGLVTVGLIVVEPTPGLTAVGRLVVGVLATPIICGDPTLPTRGAADMLAA